MEGSFLEALVEHAHETFAVVLIPIDRPIELTRTDFRREVLHLMDIFGLNSEYRGHCINCNYERGRYDENPDWVRNETFLWKGAVGIDYTQYTVFFATEGAAYDFIAKVNSRPEFRYSAKLPEDPTFLQSLTNIRKVKKE